MAPIVPPKENKETKAIPLMAPITAPKENKEMNSNDIQLQSFKNQRKTIKANITRIRNMWCWIFKPNRCRV